ncbi:MAG: hypothetical protein PHE70_10385 [Tepidanaerobacteraceae bacterium]|nr:hypothetical protein [Tepidanaerobacteraceae bacterium]
MKNRLKVIYLVLVVVLIILLTVGCKNEAKIPEQDDTKNVANGPFPMTLTDQMGREVTN